MKRDPRSAVPDVGNGLWDRIASATQNCLGAGDLLWNGRIEYLPPAQAAENNAMATSDGIINVHPIKVVGIMQAIDEHGPRVLDHPSNASTSWHAINSMVHEFGHLAVEKDMAMGEFGRTWRSSHMTIEEAFNEAATRDVLPEVIQQALPPELTAKIEHAQRTHPELFYSHYPGWVVGAEAFAAEVGERHGIEPSRLLRRASLVGPTDKGKSLAATIVDESGLSRLLKDGGQAWKVPVLQGRIENSINWEINKLSSVPNSSLSPEVMASGAAVGSRAAGAVLELLANAEHELAAEQPPLDRTREVREPGPKTHDGWPNVRFQPGELDRLHRATGGQASSTARQARTTNTPQGSGPGDDGWPNVRFQPGELDRLHRATGGQTPPSSARPQDGEGLRTRPESPDGARSANSRHRSGAEGGNGVGD